MEAILWLLFLSLIAAIFIWAFRRIGSNDQAERGATSVNPALIGRAASAADVRAFLAPNHERIEASRRAVTHINFVKMDQDDPMTSKIGGAAYWPKNQAIPVDEKGKPLFLLAQIRLDELPGNAEFPRNGMLQFFIQANHFYGANFDSKSDSTALSQQRNFKIVHWPSIESNFTTIAARASSSLPHAPTQPFRMQFVAGEESLSIGDFRFDRLYGKQGYWRALEAFSAEQGISEDSFSDLLFEQLDASGHKLGGYPYFTQEDPRTEVGLELLFQLNSDDAAQIMWGDLGVANFFIAPSDLKRGDFSRVLYNWDCH